MFRASSFVRVALAVGSIAAASPTLAADYLTTIANTNPLAYFRLDTANGTSTNGTYQTTYTNVGTTAAGGGAPIAADPANRAASFDGVAPSSIITTTLSGGIAGTGSIVAWVNLTAAPNGIMSIAGESQPGNDFDFQFEQNQLRFYTDSGSATVYTPVAATLLNNWHMVVATYDGTGGAGSDFRRIYFDGALVADDGGDQSGATKTGQFNIGNNLVFPGRELSGLIDEVAVYNRALSTNEVSSLYASRTEEGTASPTPEPATWATLVLGFGATGAAMRMRRKKAVTLA